MRKINLFLAPMAGATDSTMRLLCQNHGADGTTTEMISSAAVYYKDKKTFTLAKIADNEKNCALQIFGHDPDIMAYSVKALYDAAQVKPAAFDINMGCPVKKIISSGDGSTLMKEPLLASKIISAVCKASPVPVTVKIRAGWDKDHKNAPEIAKIAEECGASSVCIHGRTREDMYIQGRVDLDIIAKTKAAVNIPVIANGDITDGETAKKMIDYTNADALAVGRAALGDPFVFEKIKAKFYGQAYDEPSDYIRIETAILHLKGLIAEKGEKTGVCEGRRHMAYYTKGMPNSARLRQMINTAQTAAEMINILKQIEKETVAV